MLALNYKTYNKMHIFSKTTFMDKYAEIIVDISPFNDETKQSSATGQNPENHKVFSQLSAALTSIQLKMC